MIRTAILAVPGCLSSSIDGLGEILAFANSLMESIYFSTQVYTVNGTPVQSYTGKIIVPDHSITEIKADIIILPPILCNIEESLNNFKITDWLLNHHKSGGKVASVCAGSFLLAETGLLNGRTATTHWNLADTFMTRYPEVDLQIQRLIVDGGDYICCGGVSAWMDLALHLVTRFAGKDFSKQCAKMMLMDPHHEYQTPYGMAGFRKNHNDQAILKVQQLIEEQYNQSISIQKMAEVAALEKRTFFRHFQNATGISPGKYVQQVRMETARKLLETTDLSIENITESIGYIDYSAFRKLFKKTMGCTPSSYRQRFGVIR